VADASFPRIGLGGFAEFSSAMSSGRITAVQNVIANGIGEYEPSHDFYRQFRIAIAEGIANRDDELRIRTAVDRCTPRRRSHYEALAAGWSRWRRGKDLVIFSQRRDWHSEGLDVRVSPQFVWRKTNGSYLVWPYLKEPALTRDGIQAAIRLMEMTHPDTGHEQLPSSRFSNPSETSRKTPGRSFSHPEAFPGSRQPRAARRLRRAGQGGGSPHCRSASRWNSSSLSWPR